MKRRLALALLLAGGAGWLRAQPGPGSWQPTGTSRAYPRTLLGAEALPSVRTALALPERLAVYRGVWADVQQAPPAAEATSTSSQQARAAWAKNAAFVVLVGCRPAGRHGLATLTKAQHRRLTSRLHYLLASLDPAVAAGAAWAEAAPLAAWQARAQELLDYLTAYDLLRGSGESPAALAAGRARLQQLAGNLYWQSTRPLGLYSFYSAVEHNPTLLTTAALGLAAVVLNDATSPHACQQPATWASASLYNLDNVLWREAQPRAEPAVTGVAVAADFGKELLRCWPFFQALGRFLPDGEQAYTFGATTRHLRNPYFDPSYQPFYSWLAAALRPTQPAPATYVGWPSQGLPSAVASTRQVVADPAVDLRAAWLAASPGAAAWSATWLPLPSNLD